MVYAKIASKQLVCNGPLDSEIDSTSSQTSERPKPELTKRCSTDSNHPSTCVSEGHGVTAYSTSEFRIER
jgi:hypothetical protein